MKERKKLSMPYISIYVRNVTLHENKKDFSIEFIPKSTETSSSTNTTSSFITCTHGGFQQFLEMLNLQADAKNKEAEFMLIFDISGEKYFAISDSEFKKFFVPDCADVISEKEVKSCATSRRGQELYFLIQRLNGQIMKAVDQLEEFHAAKGNVEFQKKD